jgi:hypothetical protein
MQTHTHVHVYSLFTVRSFQVKIRCADQYSGGDETFEILTHVLLRMNHLKFGSCEVGYLYSSLLCIFMQHRLVVTDILGQPIGSTVKVQTV